MVYPYTQFMVHRLYEKELDQQLQVKEMLREQGRSFVQPSLASRFVEWLSSVRGRLAPRPTVTFEETCPVPCP